MALTYNGLDVRVTSDKIPYNFTLPVVTTFADATYTCSHEIVLTEASVSGATPSVEFQNIIDALNTQIQADINLDFNITGRSITAYAELTNITRNIDDGDTFYGGDVAQYICTLTYHLNTEAL